MRTSDNGTHQKSSLNAVFLRLPYVFSYTHNSGIRSSVASVIRRRIAQFHS
jgi:hypothetical protein